MGIEDLSTLDILHGILTSTFVIISIAVSLKILLKYPKHKRIELLTVGIAWLGISTPWWGNSFSFLTYISFGFKLDLFTYLLIENAFIPIALICWIYSFGALAYPALKKKFLIIIGAICIPYEIFLISALIIEPTIIGTLEGMFDSKHTIIPIAFRIFGLIVVLITGILFGRESMKSDNLVIKWKGRFLAIGIITFVVAAILDVILILNPLELIIVRGLLILSAFEYYLGFFFSERLTNLLFKKRE